MTWQRSSSCNSNACVEVDYMRSSSCDSSDCVEVAFRKATASTGNGACVEVGFRKASYSIDSANCVEVGTCGCATPAVLVRDSKDPDGPRLSVTPAAFNAFLADLKAGVHDLS